MIVATFQYQTQEARNRVRHTYLVHNQAQELLVQVLTTEISVKNYALTRQKNYLNTYQKVDQSLPISLQKLQDLVVDNPGQTQQTKKIKAAINQSQKLLIKILSPYNNMLIASRVPVLMSEQRLFLNWLINWKMPHNSRIFPSILNW